MATCGGEAVCVIDCQTGIVLHKYKSPGEVSARALLLRGGGQAPALGAGVLGSGAGLATYSPGNIFL